MSAQVFQILVTTLLTIVIGLNTWLLKTVLDLLRATAKISQQIWGVDGNNGHASDIRGFRKALREIGDLFTDLDYRVRRLEERHGVETPPRGHPRFRASSTDDDALAKAGGGGGGGSGARAFVPAFIG